MVILYYKPTIYPEVLIPFSRGGRGVKNVVSFSGVSFSCWVLSGRLHLQYPLAGYSLVGCTSNTLNVNLFRSGRLTYPLDGWPSPECGPL